MNSGVLVKWLDNKCVHVCSTYINPEKSVEVKRWDRTAKKYIKENYSEIVQKYNRNMGGVNLSDMLISLYRTNIKTKRWYIKVLYHCVDLLKSMHGYFIEDTHLS